MTGLAIQSTWAQNCDYLFKFPYSYVSTYKHKISDILYTPVIGNKYFVPEPRCDFLRSTHTYVVYILLQCLIFVVHAVIYNQLILGKNFCYHIKPIQPGITKTSLIAHDSKYILFAQIQMHHWIPMFCDT